ncbi:MULTISPECIES: sigma 54-interacting transcriptional regulator [Pseudomonas]|jgi:transcriptional regulator with PAS, ATPase and Fis domain|uniref:HrpR n=2 Tax=Pseudomonas TaxID=286 RepID=C8BNW4_PSESY|nr:MULTISPECIES: sigma-54 dependent transcriptional regulator [Pseudomonas]ACU65056.1 HrpR [Pseudomonas syringae pv. syringae]KFE48512.1 ATPase AAA [Pseudomonas congelans]KPW82077.1 HrpR [Pseudomonas congelans]MBC8800296.1 sigma-54-dependent Fis family transcriptional regulator [Pseudomonas congelans]MBP1144338.1 transcriptional regulator with PAS, ATPase and Fis domain [Pseudomonas sp. PvP027]
MDRREYEADLKDIAYFGDFVDLQYLATNTAPLNIDLLLVGETGTGKDTLARQIYRLSRRRGAFVAMNCAAIPESLAESELFGVVSGAYTGASKSRSGYVEAAQGGTLYLDEIDSMPLSLQAKLLRVLETRGVERLGSTEFIPVDMCVITSSQRPLEQLVEEGTFRRDLYFRLSVVSIQMPPLRERREQIIPLFNRFLAKQAMLVGRPAPVVTPAVTQQLLTHSWPGNIRELKSSAKRFVLGFAPLAQACSPEPLQLKAQLRVIERILIDEAMKRHQQSVEAASFELGIPSRTLYHRIKSLSA